MPFSSRRNSGSGGSNLPARPPPGGAGAVRFRRRLGVRRRRGGGGRPPIFRADRNRDHRGFALGVRFAVEELHPRREQVLGGNAAEIVGRHFPVANPVFRQFRRIAEEGRVPGQEVRLGRNPLQGIDESHLGRRLHPRQFLLRGPVRGDPLELLVHLFAEPGQGRSGPGGGDHPADPARLQRVVEGADPGRRAVFIDHPAVEPRVQSVGEDIGEHVEGRFVLVEELRRRPAAVEPGVRHRVGRHDAPGPGERRGGKFRASGSSARRDRPEVAPDELEGAPLDEVAGDHQHGVVGRVPLPEEIVDLGKLRRFEVGHVADDIPRIGVARREEGVEHPFPSGPVGHIVHPLQPLVPDHLALGVEPGLVQDIEQVGHPVGLGPKAPARAPPSEPSRSSSSGRGWWCRSRRRRRGSRRPSPSAG